MRKTIDVKKGPTKEQIEMLKKASDFSIPEDDEYPEFTDKELQEFHRISIERNSNRQKQTLTLRLSPQTIKKAKSLGKGYTSVLSRIIESVLDDPKAIKHFL